MQIDLEVIPHANQRYETPGDWYYDIAPSIPLLHVRASAMSDHRYEFLILLHEIVEAMLCSTTGVTQREVDEFDTGFTGTAEGSEPGDDPEAPYHREHVIASVVERLAAELLSVDWNVYLASLDTLKK
jgi:hypothetical protein